MCGIIGVTGGTQVTELLLAGLARLEYRGYDSAGVVLADGDRLWRARAASGTRSLEDLAKLTQTAPQGPPAGIGHTRWATHGHPTDVNAHPHLDCTGQVAVVHNGIVENCRELAAALVAGGHTLASDTDTEVIAHLVEDELRGGAALAVAVRAVLRRLRGSFALGIVRAEEPGTIVAARRVSPLVVALGDGPDREGLLASDIPAILGRARTFWTLADDQVVTLRPGSVEVTDLDGTPVAPRTLQVDWDLEAAEKGGFDDFMSKEMREQPQAVRDTLLGRALPDGTLAVDELRLDPAVLRRIDKVFIVACGSSFHAGLVAKHALERWLHIPVEIDIASEFRYRDPVLDQRTLVVGVSQSGETVDTLQAMRHASTGGAPVLVISNVVDSSMAREADGVLYTRAGPEIGVAATKTHLAQIAALHLLGLTLAQQRASLPPAELADLLAQLRRVPELIGDVLGRDAAVAAVARRFVGVRDFFFLGRHVGYPVAMEGALKLKEIAYVRAEAYPAGELKHGPIALVEPGTVVVGVATRNRLWEKMLSNVAEVRSRGATVVLVGDDGDDDTAAEADHVLWVPPVHELLSPLVDVVPLQQFAYHLARAHQLDVDRPRNLAKTVTVE